MGRTGLLAYIIGDVMSVASQLIVGNTRYLEIMKICKRPSHDKAVIVLTSILPSTCHLSFLPLGW